MQILKTIPYSEFYMWDVKRYNYVFNNSFENGVFLRDILVPFKQTISKEELNKNKWRIIQKINFQGELFLRDISEIKSYKGKVYKVPENSIIYSKINVRHGCVYYHKKWEIPFAVSSEYPTFLFNTTKVNGYYLILVLRSNEFKKLLNTKTSGISKARVKEDEFLDIQIPLPPLEEQNRIVATYNAKIQLANEQETKAQKLKQEIEDYMFKVLGVNKKENDNIKKGLRVIEYSKLTKWALSHSLKQNKFNIQTSKYSTTTIKDILLFFKGGKTPSKQRKDFWNGKINWTSPKDFNGLYIDKSEDHITEKAVIETKMEIFPAGTLVSVFRSGILRHSFPTAIINIPTTINQDLKAYDLKEDIINKKYYLYFTEVFKEYILLNASKKSVTVESINTEEFLELKIPLPPLDIQTQIANHISGLKQQIKDLQNQAKENREKAIKEFEGEIFTKS